MSLLSNLVVIHSNSPTRGVFGSDNKEEVGKVSKPFVSADSFGVQIRTCWDATLLEAVLTHPWEWGIHFPLRLNPQILSDSVRICGEAIRETVSLPFQGMGGFTLRYS